MLRRDFLHLGLPMAVPLLGGCASRGLGRRKAPFNYDASDFKGYRSPHVVIHSDASESSVQDVAQRLEEIWSAITTTMIRAKEGFPLEIILFNDPYDFKELTNGHLAGVFMHVHDRGVMMLPYEDGGYEWGPAGLRSDSLQIAVHEMGHRLVDDVLPTAPSWFHEGLASFIETAFIRDNYVSYGVPSALVLYTLREAPILPFETLLNTRVGDQRNHEARYYATAWLLIHYIFLGDDGRNTGLFKSLWKGIAHREPEVPWEQVLVDVFEGRSPEQLEADLQRHADSVVAAKGRIQRLRQIPVEPVGEVALHKREPDAGFVRDACVELRRLFQKENQ